MVRASKSAKTTLAVGQFEEWQNDSRALVDSATAARLRSDLATSAPDGVAPAQELLDSLGIVLWEALDIVFVVASVKAVLSLGFALFLRMPVRSETASGDAVDTDGELKPQHQPVCPTRSFDPAVSSHHNGVSHRSARMDGDERNRLRTV